MDPIDERLRRDLHSLDMVSVPAAAALQERVESRTARHRRRLRAVASFGAAAVVVASGLVAWRLNDVREPQPSGAASTTDASAPSTIAMIATTATTSAANANWTSIAPDPRGQTRGAAVVWTGKEIVAVGGFDPDNTVRESNAAYSPATNSWRTLAVQSDVGKRVNVLTAWTGSEALFIGGDNPDLSLLVSYATAYNPTTDSWRIIASPPIGFITSRSPAVWDGTRLLVWPGDGGGASMPITPIAYDATTDTWTSLPQPPVERRQSAASVWTGSEWIVWGGTNDGPDLNDGVAFNPVTGTWRTLSASPLSARRVNGVWTGTEMLIAAGGTGGVAATGSGSNAQSDGAAYDPSTDTWRSIADGPAHPQFMPFWFDSRLVLIAKGGAVIYDPTLDTWADAGSGPITPFDAEAVIADDKIVIIGGADDTTGGATFRLP